MASFLIGLHECRLLGSFTQPGWRRGTWPVSSGRLALLLFAQSIDGAHCLDGQSVECERRLTNLGLEDACGLGQQDLAGLEIGKLLDTLGAQLSTVHRAGLQHEGGVVLSKITQGLGSLNGLAGDESDGRGTLEVLSQEVETDLLGRQARPE